MADEVMVSLQLGSQVMVQVAPGMKLRNADTGQWFAEGEPTLQTVTVTLLARLRDGDLLLVGAAGATAEAGEAG